MPESLCVAADKQGNRASLDRRCRPGDCEIQHANAALCSIAVYLEREFRRDSAHFKHYRSRSCNREHALFAEIHVADGRIIGQAGQNYAGFSGEHCSRLRSLDSLLVEEVCRFGAAVPRLDFPSSRMEALLQPAAHKPKADKSDPDFTLLEFCRHWHDLLRSAAAFVKAGSRP
ncbi:MAG: hypothetical protein JOZ83_06190 [Silvibacterium sp.]|nr:hypothetical protein [Silvibacterium sp.]